MPTKELITLASHALHKTGYGDYAVSDVEGALRAEIKKLVGNYNDYRRNRLDLFELLQESFDEVLPVKVEEIFGRFATVKQYAQGQKPQFNRTLGKKRAKQFVTKVGPAGIYETFRLDRSQFDISTEAIGGAARIDFERYLDGLEDIVDLYDIVLEGMQDWVYSEVQKALLSSWNAIGRPAANKYSTNAFNADKMAELCTTVSAYGMPVIFCAPQFAATMNNAMTGSYNPNIPAKDLDEIRENGYITKFRSYTVVVLPQSFVDETNTKFVVNPRVAYIIPAGKEKLVYIAMEGDTVVDDYKNKGDRSMEIQIYKKMGVGLITPLNNWAMYQNTSIVASGWDTLN